MHRRRSIQPPPRRAVVAPMCALLLFSLSLWLPSPVQAGAAAPPGAVEIRRTTDGVAHIRAGDWRELGLGVGYVQAQDALCTLADAFVTYAGQRAWYFGAERRLPGASSMGRPKNIDADFFFKAFADEDMVATMRQAQPAELTALVAGYADGYNRLLREARARPSRHPARACLKEPWVRDIAPSDIYRRLYAAQVMAGYGHFMTDIVNARPASERVADAADVAALQARLANNLGAQAELGSNAIAWGRAATGDDGALLFGNPHWFWGGPDRFYQMHLTIPGQLNVAGAGFLGVPLVMIGFNDNVAWSHTVSRTRRFGLFELALDPADPERYLVDGVSTPLSKRHVTVAVRDADGGARQVGRTLYASRFGPVVDLRGLHPALAWSAQRAMAVRDVNGDNWRIFRNFLAWDRAASLDDFMAIQRREAAMPWVNTLAVGRGDGRVWYADIGAVPNVPDDLRRDCAAPLAAAFAGLDPRTPVLDGTRSACEWRLDAASAQPGAMPAQRLPSLLREDYVANMNDSHWLSNVHQPLEGYSALQGDERTALSFRGRLGHELALDLARRGAGSAAELGTWAARDVLSARVYTAEQYKQPLLDQACGGDATSAAADVARACAVLRVWGNTGEVGDRGALLWETFWRELEKGAGKDLFTVAFSADAPLRTPAAPRPADGVAAKALAAAAMSLTARGVALDEAADTRRAVRSGGKRWPIYGGCGDVGYFATVCPDVGELGLGPNVVANSYLQIVRFGQRGVEARTLLAHGQDERAVRGGPGSGPVARYARKDWLAFPFREDDILRDPHLSTSVLRP
ncbi:penicillin acylase family protein [Oxalobacteraceae bacterium OTU3CAMAD1]|nr:penicillin acylase family protein [Oxalobacteraceae bacterium OTU3CAMAD1]